MSLLTTGYFLGCITALRSAYCYRLGGPKEALLLARTHWRHLAKTNAPAVCASIWIVKLLWPLVDFHLLSFSYSITSVSVKIHLYLCLNRDDLHCCTCVLLWLPCVADADIIFLPCGFFLLLSSRFFYSSPNLSGRRLDVYHTSTHGVALVRM